MSNGLHPKAMREIKNAYASCLFDFFMDDGKYNPDEPNNCYLRWRIESGMYKGQVHLLQIRWCYGSNEPKQYPMNPPNVTFLSPMWHTNVNCSGGSICVDVLRMDPTNPQAWSPMYGLDTIFNSIILLLDEHNVNSAYNGTASNDYTTAKNMNDMSYFMHKSEDYYNKVLTKAGPDNMVNRLLKAPEFEKKTPEKV